MPSLFTLNIAVFKFQHLVKFGVHVHFMVNTIQVPLKTGQNILYWKTVGINFDAQQAPKPVLIKKIEISGEYQCMYLF